MQSSLSAMMCKVGMRHFPFPKRLLECPAEGWWGVECWECSNGGEFGSWGHLRIKQGVCQGSLMNCQRCNELWNKKDIEMNCLNWAMLSFFNVTLRVFANVFLWASPASPYFCLCSLHSLRGLGGGVIFLFEFLDFPHPLFPSSVIFAVLAPVLLPWQLLKDQTFRPCFTVHWLDSKSAPELRYTDRKLIQITSLFMLSLC